MRFESSPKTMTLGEVPVVVTSVAQCSEERSIVDSFSRDSEGSSSDISMAERLTSLSDEDNGIPHDAPAFCSSYRLCCGRIHIDQPLNQRITDDLLFQLCSKAQGSLQCLRLVECLKITDDGLRRVVESNAHLTKLCVPGCTKLSIDGIINIVKDVNSRKGAQGIKTLRIVFMVYF
ncbi:hypothetical protein Leryth_018068 [Lithospermum erythrorhizon]|nr:hypothetical protein Leryth_018068 [Lithospermum erythrorhizon]